MRKSSVISVAMYSFDANDKNPTVGAEVSELRIYSPETRYRKKCRCEIRAIHRYSGLYRSIESSSITIDDVDRNGAYAGCKECRPCRNASKKLTPKR